MKTVATALTFAVLALAGCGDDDESADTRPATAPEPPTTEPEGAATERERPERTGATITAHDSEFGEILFDSERQAIYIFENDPRDDSVCYGECADAWPPVLSEGEPQAEGGVDASLLGTIERRGGSRQVTYDGKPLYYYAHEGPGEVKCHNVHLNGGFWWVVGPDGKRRP